MTTTEASSEVDGEQQSTVQGSLDQPNEKPPLQFRDRIKDFRRVRAGDLIPNPRNSRIHPKSQADALRGLLAELGFADALLTRELPDGRLMLIDGHLRKENVPPDAQVPVLVLDVTEEEADKILLTLDPLATMAEADTERIKALLATVRTESEAVQELLKRTAGDRLWEILHPHEIKEVEVTLERADELRAKWGIGAGQVWQAGPHRMGCGDSTDQTFVTLLWGRRGPTCRLVWTDPPYGVDYASKNAYLNKTDRGNRVQRPIENDNLTPEQTSQLFKAALGVAIPRCESGASCYATVPSGPLLVYFIHAFDASGFEFKHLLVWVKHQFVIGMADYHYRHEPILYGWLPNGAHYFRDNRSQNSVFEVDKPQVNALHPTTKPVELISRMVANSSRPGELIYDPFAGSGSTILAAHQLGRIGYGCEIDAGYVAVTLERLSLLGLKPERVDR